MVLKATSQPRFFSLVWRCAATLENMVAIGKRNTLPIVRASAPGLYLDGGELGEILLPGRYIPKDLILLCYDFDLFLRWLRAWLFVAARRCSCRLTRSEITSASFRRRLGR